MTEILLLLNDFDFKSIRDWVSSKYPRIETMPQHGSLCPVLYYQPGLILPDYFPPIWNRPWEPSKTESAENFIFKTEPLEFVRTRNSTEILWRNEGAGDMFLSWYFRGGTQLKKQTLFSLSNSLFLFCRQDSEICWHVEGIKR